MIDVRKSGRVVLGTIMPLILLPVILHTVACGGGGGGDDSSSLPPPPIVTGSLPEGRELQGGDTTTSDRTALAFEHPASNLSSAEDARHTVGDANFGAKFVSPPSVENPGLGPIFNNSSCDGCHTKNGRGQPVVGTGPLGSQGLVRISTVDGAQEFPGAARDVPGLGTQLQDHAIVGATAEGTVSLKWETVSGKYGDGTSYELRRPNVSITLADGSKLPSNVMTSFRTGNPVFGLGLLEAVTDETIEAMADPNDANADGISGHVNRVWDVVLAATKVGRFGRKASNPDLIQQAAGAFINDIGVTNPLFPGADNAQEIDNDILSSVEFYVQTLAVPVAANVNDPIVKKGGDLFVGFQCAACHMPKLTTGTHKLAALSNQTIFPYTDLLLHDMGPDLADGRPDFEADGSEWRTAPLWGIGVTATILSNTATFLHDGRARTLEEAILWHGGEAQAAREVFRTSSKEDRDALLQFLKSL